MTQERTPTALIVSVTIVVLTIIISLVQCGREYMALPPRPPDCEVEVRNYLGTCTANVDEEHEEKCVAASEKIYERCKNGDQGGDESTGGRP